jgi:hypothetical protein
LRSARFRPGHKLVEHWRRIAREERSLAVADAGEGLDDPWWDDRLDAAAAYAALSRLSVQQRVALTLRYLDGLPVAEVAEQLGRTLHATETLSRQPVLGCVVSTESRRRAMTADPFDALRLPIVPVEPRREFADALLRRIEEPDRLLLSVPGGVTPCPTVRCPSPVAGTRISLRVPDLAATVEALRRQGANFRTDIVAGGAVNQILLQDPSGNLIELFEPRAGCHERPPDKPS